MSQTLTKPFNNPVKSTPSGLMLVNKPAGVTSFDLVKALRRKLHVKTIGHAGTLDPFATGVMILLVGREYTKKSDTFLNDSKEYTCTIKLGEQTNTFDCDGEIISASDIRPSDEEVQKAVDTFQGEIEQTPPMFSAKKINGKKLCNLARQGIVVERKSVTLTVTTTLIDYTYPYIQAHIKCSKGTYIRSIADDMGKLLQCGAHLSKLCRVKSGQFSLEECIDGNLLFDKESDLLPYLRQSIYTNCIK